MTDVEHLLAFEEIKQVKARYFRCMDTKDWEGFARVFAADAVMAYLFAAQGYPVTTGLFLTYLIIAVIGFREWLGKYRQQAR